MRKLKHSEVKPTREARWVSNKLRCEICGLSLKQSDIVLDHCHKRGWIRGAVHRGCNSLLGNLENNAPRFGIPTDSPQFFAFLHGSAGYLQRNTTCHTGLIHPLYKDENEKREIRNKKARIKRAASKVT